MLLRVLHMARFADPLLAISFVVSGCCALFIADRSSASVSTGSNFALGATMGCLISPCCTPALISCIMLGYAGGAWLTALYLIAFAAAQMLPAVALGLGYTSFTRRLPGEITTEALSVASAIFSLALGAYYALLCV